jgi:hypothetical protein
LVWFCGLALVELGVGGERKGWWTGANGRDVYMEVE